uniref:Uncharacterized protein n=1 Tax=Nicotiana tabacum TaxID=4097 RepID=A0A1S4B6D1_TOBAC|nr:PREDICTED: uncharacterized protein LOC107804969 [Nicotiana tabacum]
MARFQTPGVLLVCGEHPIITTRPEIMLAMSAEDKKKLDRFQRLHPPHFDCDTSKDDKDFLDRCHQMHCNLGLAVKKGRDPTPTELHLHVHTYGNDGKSFVVEKSRIVHENYQEILKQQTQTQSDIDQCKAYNQPARGKKKRRVYGLGSQAKCYYGPNLHDSFGSDATSSAIPPNAQSTPIWNLDEIVMRLIPALAYHIVPVIVERVRELVSLPSHPPNTDLTNHPLDVALTVFTFSTAANIDEVHALGSDDDRNSPSSHS